MNSKLRAIIGFAVVIALWQVLSWLHIFNPIYFASPLEVGQQLVVMIKSGSIIWDTLWTLRRLLLSVLIAVVLGIPLGIVLGFSARFYDYIGGILDFLRSLPPIVLYPLLLISLGIGDGSRVGVSAFGACVVMIFIVAKGLMQQSPLRRTYFRSLGAPTSAVVRDVVWYEALPHMMVGLRTAVSLGLVIVVVTEMLVGAKYGLGTRVQNVQITSNIPDLFATLLIIGIVGMILNHGLIWLYRKLVFWKAH